MSTNTRNERGIAGMGLVAIGTAVSIIVIITIFLVSLNSNQKQMVSREAALSGQYKQNINDLSAYVNTIKESLGLANTANAALDKVLADAVSGRYEGKTSAQPGTGTLFSAITEAYPDLTRNADLYSTVQDAILKGRERFKNKQDKLGDMIREYDTWRKSGYIHSFTVRLVGAPSENLRASIGADTVTGQAAYERMNTQVVAGPAAEAFKTGIDNGLDLGPTPTPSVAK